MKKFLIALFIVLTLAVFGGPNFANAATTDYAKDYYDFFGSRPNQNQLALYSSNPDIYKDSVTLVHNYNIKNNIDGGRWGTDIEVAKEMTYLNTVENMRNGGGNLEEEYKTFFNNPNPDPIQLALYSSNPERYKKAVADLHTKDPVTGEDKWGNNGEIAQAMSDAAASSCGPTEFGCQLKEALYWLINLIGNVILSIAAWILWACGIVFNYSITELVVKMKAQVGNIPAIFTTWQTVRDLANMFFIFVLLVIAIQTILGEGNYKTMLKNVVLVALFINFSFFFSGLMIDASNILALQFYNGFADSTSNCPDKDGCISQKIVSGMHLTGIYGMGGSLSTTGDVKRTQGLSAQSNLGQFLIVVLFGSVLMIVAGGIFLASSVLIVYRFVVLIFLLMFSPIAFATIMLPAMKRQGWDKWWDKLKTQLIFAPAYFMFLWATMAIISKLGNMFGTVDFTTGISGNGVSISGLIISFVIVITLLISSLTLAKELGASGAGMANTVSKGFQGFFAKHTAGRGAAWLDKKWAKSTVPIIGGTGFLGNKLRNVTTTLAAKKDYGQGSFVDYQKSEKDRIKSFKEQVRKNKNDATIGAGIDALGVGSAARTPEQNIAVQNLANYVKIAGNKDLTGLKAKELEALAKAGMLTPDKATAILDDKNENHTGPEKDKIREAYSKEINDALTAHLNTPSTAPQALRDSNERALRTAIANLGEDGIKIVDPSLTSGRSARSEAFIQMASGKQYKKIVESTFGEGKGIIRDARFKSIIDSATNPATPSIDIEKQFKKLDAADIAHMANSADPGTTYATAFTRILSLPNIADIIDPRKLAKAWNDEGLRPDKASLIRAAVTPAGGAAPVSGTKQAKLIKQMDDLGI